MSDNNWIEWKGGECPVPAGTLVDLRYRNNYYEDRIAVPALTFGNMSDEEFWQHENYAHECDIIAWRLHQPEQAAWNGEGLPPVGTECELAKHLHNAGTKVRVLCHDEGAAVCRIIDGDKSHDLCQLQAFEISPIRTEAERKREEAIEAIYKAYQEGPGDVEEAVYDAIAAGKIPGVKLL